MELYWRDNYQCPSEEDYKLMTIRKTGKKATVGNFCGFLDPLDPENNFKMCEMVEIKKSQPTEYKPDEMEMYLADDEFFKHFGMKKKVWMEKLKWWRDATKHRMRM